MTNNPQGCTAKTPGFDTGHEGHSGWLSIDIANNYLQGWLQTAKPDVVQFMLGTNDVVQGRTVDAIVQSYTKIVTLLRQSNPKMRIIVSGASGSGSAAAPLWPRFDGKGANALSTHTS
jgi:lysophospholipase L1-like esterase